MNELIINDESINIKDLTIDFINKDINIVENDINSNVYKFFRNIMCNQKIDKLVYLKDENEKLYIFYDCYLGKHSIGNNSKISIKFSTFITNYYIEYIKNLQITETFLHI